MLQNRNLSSSGTSWPGEAWETTQTIATEFSKQSFKETPLTALRSETVSKLSNLLNNFKIIHSHDGYERDWRGLATLSEQRNLYNATTNNMAHNDPFKRIIEQWCEHNPPTATFGNLVKYLGQIDRWHVIEDVAENLFKDFQTYQTMKEQAISKLTDNN